MPDDALLSLQTDHLKELQARYESALAEHGYDSLLIASGAAPYRYGDDQAWHFQGYGPFLDINVREGFPAKCFHIENCPFSQPKQGHLETWVHCCICFWPWTE